MSTDVVVPDRKARIAEATDYRKQSASYSEIAEAMGITIPEAVALVQEHLTSEAVDDPETQRRLDLSRIEVALSGIAQQVAAGDGEAIRTMLSLMDKREKIEAKAPVRVVDLFR